MRFQTLDAWLDWQQTLHPQEMDLGLERARAVASRMDLERPPFRVVSVAGTNGKGSCVMMLAALLEASGLRVGAYMSPHLLRYNERVRVDGAEVSDATLIAAFAKVDAARGETSLTFFEFGTLAAMDIFCSAGVDVAVLEVGLGGRLDAVNLFDAKVALVTAIGVDHTEWLGSDVNTIAVEKAGIFRPSCPAVCGAREAPASLERCAAEASSPYYCLGRDFDYEAGVDGWTWRSNGLSLSNLPRPGIAGARQLDNAAAVLKVYELLQSDGGIDPNVVSKGLREATLVGRFHRIVPPPVERIIDVAHNVQAAQSFRDGLLASPPPGRTLAVVTMLRDKDIPGVLDVMRDIVGLWYTADTPGARGATGDVIAAQLASLGVEAPIIVTQGVLDAYAAAVEAAAEGDRVIVFGSFHAAGSVLRLESRRRSPETA